MGAIDLHPEVNLKILRICAAVLAAAAIPAHADFTDTAEVISSVPIYGSINEPRQQCWTETVTTPGDPERGYMGTIVGGVAGGLIGSTIGSGNGQVAAAAAGAALGALAGNSVDERNARPNPQPQQVQRCQTVNSASQGITGYRVTYNYNGRNSTVVLPYDPGQRIQVSVNASGAETVAPSQAGPVAPQLSYLPSGQPVIPYVNERGEVPIWAYKPYKRPRPAPAPEATPEPVPN